MKFKRSFNDIITAENLLCAWQVFFRGKREKKDVILFQTKLMDNIFQLRDELKGKTYRHGGYHSFNVSDPKPRNIHKASVRDRLLHHLLFQELYPFFERKFIYDSYSCRLDKGTHKAIRRFVRMARKVSKNNTHTCWVLKCDIKKFFANIDHSVLKTILGRCIDDRDILWLTDSIIDSFSTQGKTEIGLPLGNLTSQLFVNIYLNEFDQFVKRGLKVKYYIRYADDFVVLSADKQWLVGLLPLVSGFLSEKLHLYLHADKVFTKTLASGIDFLGWVHFPDHRVLRTSTKRRMMNRISQSKNLQTLNSYLGMLGYGNTHKLQEVVLRHPFF